MTIRHQAKACMRHNPHAAAPHACRLLAASRACAAVLTFSAGADLAACADSPLAILANPTARAAAPAIVDAAAVHVNVVAAAS